ncbi:MAG TPA: M20/M25/M40 family metallo-hydrolase, partial [Thermoanaerobaculia bacterium]|nr:M20/M25/M40 family metallo-hydrolase [Thermoanaerobaculia bacterium]
VRIDTSNAGGIARGARWVHGQLAARGVQAELIESTPGHLNVYARIKGTQPGNGLLLFNHIDVVAPGDGWKVKPFEGEVELNQLYGRGVLDMKAMALAQLIAFADVARSGRAPRYDLVFLATAEEERGSRNGMLWLLEHRPDVFQGITYGITEGGLTEIMTEKMTYFGIEVGGKQPVAVTLQGDRESLRQARFRLQRWIVRRDVDRVLPEVRQYFRDVAPTRVKFRSSLEDVDGAIARGEFWELPGTYQDFVQDSLWVSEPWRHDGDTWRMRVRMRNLPDSNPDERIEWLRGVVTPLGAAVVSIDETFGPVPLSTSNTPLFRLLEREAERRYQVDAGVQVLFRSFTDSRFLRTRGIVSYGVCPFPVDYFQSLSIHGRDERIRVDWFGHGVEYMRTVTRAWAFPAAG